VIQSAHTAPNNFLLSSDVPCASSVQGATLTTYNYNLDEGEISDYLEITVIYGDGHEDIAYYQLLPEEKEMFLRKMDAYCQETAGISLAGWEQQYMQEQREAQQRPEM